MASPVDGGDLMAQIRALMGGGELSDEERKSQRQQAAFAAAAGLLSNMYKPTGVGLGAGIGAGLLGYNEAGQSMRRDKLANAANLHQAIQSQQALQGMQQNQQIQNLGRDSMIPGQAPMGPPAPDGSLPPGIPAQFDKRKYQAGLWGIDPAKALAFEAAQAKESPFAKLNPADYSPESVQAFMASNNPADLRKAEEPASKAVGQVNTSNYTPASIAKFAKSRDYADLVPTATPNEISQDARARELADLKRQENALKRKEIEGVDAVLSPEAIANAAARYNIDGTLPPMGMGQRAGNNRNAILNAAAIQSAGISPTDLRLGQIDNKAGAAANTKIAQNEAVVGAFERTFNKNLAIVEQYSDKVDRTGVPIANKWINAGKRAIAGDPELAAYDLAIKSVSNEYAKIVSGSMGNTAVAESEIKKTEALLNAAQTPEQVAEVVGIMKRETANRMQGFKEQRAAIREGMGGKKADDTPHAAPQSGGKTVIAPDGTTLNFPSEASAKAFKKLHNLP